MKLSIIIPVYNEAGTIGQVLDRVIAADVGCDEKEIIVVNDGSTDGTKNILRALHSKYPFLSLVEKQKNEGPARALFDGMEQALEVARFDLPLEKTIIVRMDSDMEHIPEDIPRLLEPIISGESRLSVGYIPFDLRSGVVSKLFNSIIGKSESKKFLGVEIPQFCPGFNAVRADLLARMSPKLKEKAAEFSKTYGKDMLTIDFVILVLAKELGEKINVVRLSPINDKWIKKASFSKLSHYLDYHKKTVEFLKKSSRA